MRVLLLEHGLILLAIYRILPLAALQFSVKRNLVILAAKLPKLLQVMTHRHYFPWRCLLILTFADSGAGSTHLRFHLLTEAVNSAALFIISLNDRPWRRRYPSSLLSQILWRFDPIDQMIDLALLTLLVGVRLLIPF